MEKTLKILKINGLSLLALPLLLIATFCKLTAKALEKITIFLGLLVLAIILFAILSMNLKPSNIFQLLAGLIVVLAMCGAIIAIAFWVFALISGVLVLIWTSIIGAFNYLYERTYRRYLKLYAACEADYNILSINGKKVPNALACIFYTILKGLSWLITSIISLSYILAIGLSAIIVLYSLLDLNSNVKFAFGMNLFQYTKKCDLHSSLFGILIYLVLFGILIAGIFALASEWYEWGKELRMNSKEISDEVIDIVNSKLQRATGTSVEVEKNLDYLKKIEAHVDQLDPISKDVTTVLDQKDNSLLRSYWGIYMENLSHLVEECSDKKGISVHRFKQLIPQIQLLDKQRSDVVKLVTKLARELQNPSGTSVFFSGCDSIDKLEKRYKALCKTYHPDIAEGDMETFQRMQAEYESLKKILSMPKQTPEKKAEKH